MRTVYKIGTPIFLPERASDLPRLLSRPFEPLQPDLLRAVTEFVEELTQDGFLGFEEAVLHTLQVLGSHIVAGAVAYLHENAALVETGNLLDSTYPHILWVCPSPPPGFVRERMARADASRPSAA